MHLIYYVYKELYNYKVNCYDVILRLFKMYEQNNNDYNLLILLKNCNITYSKIFTVCLCDLVISPHNIFRHNIICKCFLNYGNIYIVYMNNEFYINHNNLIIITNTGADIYPLYSSTIFNELYEGWKYQILSIIGYF